MLEYEAVLTRAEHLHEAKISASNLNSILDALAAHIEPVRLPFLWRPALKDPSDEMVLDTAVNGGADFLVTFSLRHFAEVGHKFGLKVVKPGELWRQIQREIQETRK